MTTLRAMPTRIVAALSAAILVAGGALAFSMSPAAAITFGTATVSPNSHLSSGDVVTATIGGFPANVMVFGVQCDQQVEATGDNTYCDVTNVAMIMTDADGNGTGTFTVKSGADFVSANGLGVCDAQTPCDLAFQYTSGEDTTAAIAGLSFGAKTKTAATSKRTAYTAGQSAVIKVAVTDTSDATPTGNVVVKDNGKVVATLELPESGVLKVERKLKKGEHKITVRYEGDTAFSASSDSLNLVAKKKN